MPHKKVQNPWVETPRQTHKKTSYSLQFDMFVLVYYSDKNPFVTDLGY